MTGHERDLYVLNIRATEALERIAAELKRQNDRIEAEEDRRQALADRQADRALAHAFDDEGYHAELPGTMNLRADHRSRR